jgi:hypothetical protein
MPKGHKSKHGYATVSGDFGGLDYRNIAETMSAQGFKMNHATARNVFLRAMKKLAMPIHEMYDRDMTDQSIMVTAKDPRFQESMFEIVGDIVSSDRCEDEIDL